ncbi:Scaffold-type E3 ligase, partial [Ascosphaera acerosa]
MAAYTNAQKAAMRQFASVTGASKGVCYLNATAREGQIRSDTSSLLSRIFDEYRDDAHDKLDTIGIDGAMAYLRDIGVPLDEVVCLAIAELLKSETIGEFRRQEFIRGWQT